MESKAREVRYITAAKASHSRFVAYANECGNSAGSAYWLEQARQKRLDMAEALNFLASL